MSLNFGSAMVYIPVLIGLLFVFGYYFCRKKQGWFTHKEGEEVSEVKGINIKGGSILCRIADNVEGRIYNAKITKAQAEEIINEHHTLGRQWSRDNEKVYGLNRYQDKKGIIKFKPIIIPQEITNAPSELHFDMQHPGLEMIVTEMLKAEDKPFMEQYGWLLAWVIGMGFLAFLWSTA